MPECPLGPGTISACPLEACSGQGSSIVLSARNVVCLLAVVVYDHQDVLTCHAPPFLSCVWSEARIAGQQVPRSRPHTCPGLHTCATPSPTHVISMEFCLSTAAKQKVSKLAATNTNVCGHRGTATAGMGPDHCSRCFLRIHLRRFLESAAAMHDAKPCCGLNMQG